MFDYKHVFGERGHLYNRASQQYPLAREIERQLMIDRLDLRVGIRICDAPAGGGYLANGIADQHPDVTVICVEPAERFAAGINSKFERIVAPLHDIPVADATFDRVGSLAGLHHLPSKMAFYKEAFRTLRTGGMIVVADVQIDSPPAKFLNGPCHEYSETGHEGEFIAPGEFVRELSACGFQNVAEAYCQYTWNFPDEDAMVRYCKDLFGLTKQDEAGVMAAIQKYLSYTTTDAGTGMDWSLLYAVGVKV